MKSLFQRKNKREHSADAKQAEIRLRWLQLSNKKSDTFTRHNGDAALVGSKIYCFGIPSMHRFTAVFSLNNCEWNTIPFPFVSRYNHTCTLADDKIYMYGGQFDSYTYSSQLVVLDPALNEACEAECFKGGPGARRSMSAVWAPWLREIVYFGGMRRAPTEKRCNDLYGLNVDTRSWREIKLRGKLPGTVSGHSAVVVGTKMYAYGGYSIRYGYMADIWLAELASSWSASWSHLKVNGREPIGRNVAALNYVAGMLILYGGRSLHDQVRYNLECFMIDKNEWRSATGKSIDVTGEGPYDTECHLAVEQSDGVIYITQVGVYKLEIES